MNITIHKYDNKCKCKTDNKYIKDYQNKHNHANMCRLIYLLHKNKKIYAHLFHLSV